MATATRVPSPSPRSSFPTAAEDSARCCAGAFSHIRNARLMTRLLRSPLVQAPARLWRGQTPSPLRPLGGGLDAIFVDLRSEPNDADRLHRYYTVLMMRTGDFADFSARHWLGTQYIVRLRAMGGVA